MSYILYFTYIFRACRRLLEKNFLSFKQMKRKVLLKVLLDAQTYAVHLFLNTCRRLLEKNEKIEGILSALSGTTEDTEQVMKELEELITPTEKQQLEKLKINLVRYVLLRWYHHFGIKGKAVFILF